MNKKKEHKFLKNVLIYAVFFIGIVAFMLYIFFKYRKGFIWQEDGLNQHIVTLSYFRELLINLLKTGEFSTFTWNIGNGINLYGNFAYYILGDIFSYFSILVPSKYLEYFYSAMVIVRMFCIGVSFLYFCNYKKMSRNSSVIGALMYTFCTFALLAAVRHPYFCNILILFPLAMVGIEKIVKENKTIFYTIIISLLFISNFYFAYMMSVIIAIYGIALIICTYKEDGIKKIILKLLQVLLYSVIGVLISAAVLVPTAMEFLNSERSGTNGVQPYSLSYYRKLVCNIIDCKSGSYWVYTGVQSIIMIALPIFVKNRKKDYPMFWLLTILIFPLLISNVGSMLCGFAYPNNRWTFVVAFIFSYITTLFINDGCKIKENELKWVIAFLVIFMALNIIAQMQISTFVLIQLLIFLLLLTVILNKEKLKNKMFKNTNLYKVLFTRNICVWNFNNNELFI